MKRTLTLLLLAVSSAFVSAQTMIDFEEFGLSTDEFLNGSDGSGGFDVEGFFFPNSYNANWMSWSGWSISATTDTTTPGFMNDLSAITGGGANGSTTYATAFVAGSSVIHRTASDIAFDKFQITNSTYSYLSMLEGDAIAKKFGGEDGTDPDFLLLTIKGWFEGDLLEDSIDFYLADYRFADNSMDYIVSDWQTVDLGGLNHADSLIFTMSSSDNGAWGMNTPAYFCIDNMEWIYILDAEEQQVNFEMSTFPNPAVDVLNIDWKEATEAQAIIFTANGQQLIREKLTTGINSLSVSHLSTGLYALVIQTKNGWTSRKIVKE